MLDDTDGNQPQVQAEGPSLKIYEFNGFVDFEGTRYLLSAENLLLRDCVLRHTDVVYGVVIYTGHQTKAMLNNTGPRYEGAGVYPKGRVWKVWFSVWFSSVWAFGRVGGSYLVCVHVCVLCVHGVHWSVLRTQLDTDLTVDSCVRTRLSTCGRLRTPRYKRSKLERDINAGVLLVIAILITLCVTGSIANYVYNKQHDLRLIPFDKFRYQTGDPNLGLDVLWCE